MQPASLSPVPSPRQNASTPLTSGLFRPSEPLTRSGFFRSVLSESTRTSTPNLGAFPPSFHAPGEVVSNWPLMPLWRPTSPIWNRSRRPPTSSWLRGTASFCVCQGISADFERLPRLRPLLVDAPASAYRAPTLDWTPPPIIEALRHVNANPRRGIEPSLYARCEPSLHDRCEPSLHDRCDFCGRLAQEEDTEDGINAHFISCIRFYRMEQAIVDDDWKRLMQWLTRTRSSFNVRDSNHYTPLHLAVLHRRENIALNLIKSGAYINAATIEGYTPLMLAVRCGDVRIVRMLLLHDASVRAQSHAGVTALSLAIAYRNETLVHMMLQYGAMPTGGRPSPYFHRALYMGPESIADAIWAAGASVNQYDAHGRSAILIAAIYNRKNILLRMLPHATPATLLDAWRGTNHHPLVHRELIRRVAGLRAHVKDCLNTWALPHDVEIHILEYLYKGPQHKWLTSNG